MSDSPPWECRARPAPSGKPCGRLNAGAPVVFQRRVVCAGCGCTKKASDDRSRKERLASGNALPLESDRP